MSEKNSSIYLKTTLIGFLLGLVLSIINIILGYLPSGVLSDFMISPDLFGLIPCEKLCWSFWGQITFIEITLICTLIGFIIGIINYKKSK